MSVIVCDYLSCSCLLTVAVIEFVHGAAKVRRIGNGTGRLDIIMPSEYLGGLIRDSLYLYVVLLADYTGL